LGGLPSTLLIDQLRLSFESESFESVGGGLGFGELLGESCFLFGEDLYGGELLGLLSELGLEGLEEGGLDGGEEGCGGDGLLVEGLLVALLKV